MRRSCRTRCHGARACNPTRNTPPARSAPCSIEPAPLPPARPPIHPTSHGAQTTTATTAAAPRARRASARCHACAGRLLRAGRVVPRALPPLILPLLPPSGAACTLERARRRLGQLGLVTLFIPPFPQHRLGSAQPLQGSREACGWGGVGAGGCNAEVGWEVCGSEVRGGWGRGVGRSQEAKRAECREHRAAPRPGMVV